MSTAMNLNTLMFLIAKENFARFNHSSYAKDWTRFVATHPKHHIKSMNDIRHYEISNRNQRRANNARHTKITGRHRYNYQNRPKIR